jgi:excisionase family DNA binding protein
VPSDLLNVPEAAEYLHLQPATLRDWILRRRLPVVKLGRRIFFKRQDLEALIESSTIPAHEERTVKKLAG